MALITDTIALPKMAFVTACEFAGITTDPHPVIGVNHHYYLTDELRTRLHQRTWETLTELGCARRERLNPLFVDTLATITEPDTEYYGWSRTTRHERGGAVLVAARDRHAVRLLVDDNAVVLDPIGVDWLPDDFVSTLPDVDGASITDTTVSIDLYQNPTRRDPRRPLAEPPDTRAVEYIQALMAAPRDGLHQLYTATQRDGKRVRSTPLTAIDITGRGRILTFTNHDSDGTAYLHVMTGTPHNLITTLETTNHGL